MNGSEAMLLVVLPATLTILCACFRNDRAWIAPATTLSLGVLVALVASISLEAGLVKMAPAVVLFSPFAAVALAEVVFRLELDEHRVWLLAIPIAYAIGLVAGLQISMIFFGLSP
jgi:hypothetical protein